MLRHCDSDNCCTLLVFHSFPRNVTKDLWLHKRSDHIPGKSLSIPEAFWPWLTSDVWNHFLWKELYITRLYMVPISATCEEKRVQIYLYCFVQRIRNSKGAFKIHSTHSSVYYIPPPKKKEEKSKIFDYLPGWVVARAWLYKPWNLARTWVNYLERGWIVAILFWNYLEIWRERGWIICWRSCFQKEVYLYQY